MKNGFIINKYGDKFYYKDSILHREDGPAIEYTNEDKEWYQNGKLHRIDGPAIEYISKDKYWFYQGKRIFCSSQQEFEKIIKLRLFW